MIDEFLVDHWEINCQLKFLDEKMSRTDLLNSILQAFANSLNLFLYFDQTPVSCAQKICMFLLFSLFPSSTRAHN